MAQDEISKKVELNWLSAFYGGLLTDKQRGGPVADGNRAGGRHQPSGRA